MHATEADTTCTISKDDQGRPVYLVADTMPSFVEGEEALYHYLHKNLNPFHQAGDLQLEFRVSFIIETDGSVSNVKAERPIVPEYFDKIQKVYNGMPKWNPGICYGEVVRVKVFLPFYIHLR